MPSRAANHFNRCALLQKGFGCGTRREIRTNAQSVIKHSPPNHLQVVPRHYHGDRSRLGESFLTAIKDLHSTILHMI